MVRTCKVVSSEIVIKGPLLTTMLAGEHRLHLYKEKKHSISQEERRRQVLEARKQARYNLLEHLREIEETSDKELDANEVSSTTDDDEEMDTSKTTYLRPYKFRKFLMTNEWMFEVPQNFSENYIAVPCPIGKRCLIVASRGYTKIYNLSGRLVTSLPTALPGGCRNTQYQQSTILDAIFNWSNKTFYIIDVILWRHMPTIDIETAFRFSWLQSRFNEHSYDLSLVTPYNRRRMVLIPPSVCTPENLSTMLESSVNYEVPLDGVMFYHKESHYTHGKTPLVNWLKPYMFQEVLGIPVPDVYMKQKPIDYTDLHSMVADKQKKRNKKVKVPNSTLLQDTDVMET